MARIRKCESYVNSVLTPVYQNAAYFYDNADTYVKALHEKSIQRGRYGRYHNPSWEDVEKVLAVLDETESCVIFPSGMSAVHSTLMALSQSGCCLATLPHLYRNTRLVFEQLGHFGIKTLVLDNADPVKFATELQQISEEIDLLFVEMPSNPNLYIADLEKIRSLLRSDALIIVDSTLASPHNLKPCLWGADLVIHSCTKYLNGHADLLLGSVAGKREIIDQIRQFRDITGAIPSPQDAFRLKQHLKTFHLRMNYLNTIGQELATFLESHPLVSRVYYLGLNSHPHSYLSQKFFTQGYGGLVTFELKLSKDETSHWIDSLKIPYIASNFGSAETYIEHLSPFSYYRLSKEERDNLNITDSLVRLSLGFNDALDDILDDLKTSFANFSSET